eukprot:2332396-Pyramimonas_sp.AAC.1
MPASQAYAGCSVGAVLMKSAPRATQQAGDVIRRLRAGGRAATHVKKLAESLAVAHGASQRPIGT